MTYELEHKIQELTARIAELEEWANRATLTLNRILGIPLEQAPQHGGRPLPPDNSATEYRDAMNRAFNQPGVHERGCDCERPPG